MCRHLQKNINCTWTTWINSRVNENPGIYCPLWIVTNDFFGFERDIFWRAWDWYRIYFHHIIRALQTNLGWSNTLRHALEFIWHVLWKCIHSKDNSIYVSSFISTDISLFLPLIVEGTLPDLMICSLSNPGDTIRWTKKTRLLQISNANMRFRWLVAS